MPIIGQISVGDGATFTPAVSSAGELSWTNNKNLPNPETVDIAQAVVDKKPGWGIPIGYEYFTINPNIPQGSLPLFGGEYSRETYPDLWAWVQEQTGYLKTEAQWQTLATANNGNVPYYSSGDGSTTFRVPSLKCWVKAANGTVTEVGSYKAAGLPNITGLAKVYTTTSNGTQIFSQVGDGSGSLYETYGVSQSYGANFSTITSKNINCAIGINASRSSSIYGNSATVQPESIVGMWLVKAYGTIVDTGQIDEQQYIDDRIAALPTSLATTFLPLAGGTMLGRINTAGSIGGSTNNGLLSIQGGVGTSGGGAYLNLYGADNSSAGGWFSLASTNGTNNYTLQGTPAGLLQWKGKDVEQVNAIGTNYIRYERGLQICWGESSQINSTGDKTITFPVAFKDTNYRLGIGREWAYNWNENYYLHDRTTTGLKITVIGTASSNNHGYGYIAVGWWK